MHRQLVEHLVGGRVVGLAAIAEGARGRPEEGEEAQALGAQDAREHEGALGLRVEHAVERLGRLVEGELVLDHAGAVDHAVEPAMLAVHTIDQRPHRRFVTRVGLAVADGAAGLRDAGEVRADLAVLEQTLVRALHLGDGGRLPGLAEAFEQGGLESLRRRELARGGRLLRVRQG
jgi:hypothetical protein